MSISTQNHKSFSLLDCFCGMGGVSDGFALEGFDVTGIDIVDAPKMLGYKHRFIQADITTLNGKDYQGYDVIWGSPPCRDFTSLGIVFGHRWKRPSQPEYGLIAVNAFLKFVEDAKPKFWIMENVANLAKFLSLKPKMITLMTHGKRHGFWGNFPPFLFPKTNTKFYIKKNGKTYNISDRKLQQWTNAKIPLACSRAFAKACREVLEPENEN
jgi:hypothetical protein